MGVGKVPSESEGSCNWAWKADITTLWAAPSSHHHTENLSGEMCDTYHKTSRGKEELGRKVAKSTARERNIQGVKWLTSAKAL